MDLEKLIRNCIKEDIESQRILFDTFSSKMMGLCVRYSNKNIHDAEDLFQEGFIKVFDKIGLFKFQGSFEGWMRRIFINLAIRKYQQEKTNKIVLNGYSHEEENPVFPEIFGQLSAQELIEVINTLPDGYRLVFNMHAIDGYSHREIGEKLNITESTSRSQLTKAKRLLKEQIKQHFGIDVNSSISDDY